MAVRLEKPWCRLDEAGLSRVHGQLGVFEVADDAAEVIYIGSADARSLFGLKGELQRWVGQAAYFRIEITSAYRTRHRELLMAYFADHNRYPEQNTPAETGNLGRISLQARTDAAATQ